jgi:hypothetical protein
MTTIYKVPFVAITKALYAALTDKKCPIGLQWFDSSVPIEEINNSFKTQAEFAYGVFGASDADCAANKTAIVWDTDIQMEVYSNYKGRKVVAEKLEAVLNYISDETGYKAIETVLNTAGYALISMTAGNIGINLPIYSDNGVWQSGGIRLSFKIGQL